MATDNKQSYSAEDVQLLVSQGIAAALKDILPAIALTPEKLREAQKPWEDPMVTARKNHEQEQWRRQEQEKEANKRSLQEHCAHKDANEKWNISLQHNYHDHLPRGICKICGLFIHPAYWDYRPVVQADGSVKDKAFIVKEHPLYHIVQLLESRS